MVLVGVEGRRAHAGDQLRRCGKSKACYNSLRRKDITVGYEVRPPKMVEIYLFRAICLDVDARDGKHDAEVKVKFSLGECR